MRQETKVPCVIDMTYNWVFPTDCKHIRGATRMAEVFSRDSELAPLRQGLFSIGDYVRTMPEHGHNGRRGRITYRYRQGRGGFLYAVALHDRRGEAVTELVEEERLAILTPMEIREYIRQRAAAELRKQKEDI